MGTLLLSRHQSLPSVHSSMADHHDPSRPRPSQQPAQVVLRPTVLQGENNAHQLDKAAKKRLLQQCHKEIRQFIGEREHAEVKIGTVEALHKTLQLLRSTVVHGETSETNTRESSSTDRTVTVVDAWPDSQEAASFSDDAWSMAPDFNDRLLVTVKISLPDGAIVDVRNVASDLFDFEHLRIGRCFFDALADGGTQLLMASAAGADNGNDRRKLFARILCGTDRRAACELLVEFRTDTTKHTPGSHSAKIYVLQLNSAFTRQPKDHFRPMTFATRHGPTSALLHVDSSAVPYIGHLPCDILGRSLLRIVHVHDVDTLKHAHHELIAHRGRLIRTKPFRLVAHNGALVSVETEWSAYFNPWTRKLDMIFGHHRIGAHPDGEGDVFSDCLSEAKSDLLLSADALRIAELDITRILAQPIPHNNVKSEKPHKLPGHPLCRSGQKHKQCTYVENRPVLEPLAASPPHSDPISHQRSTRRRDLGAYVDRLVENLVVASGVHHKALFALNPTSGDGSPEHIGSGGEMSGSPPDSSGSGPLSYNQINCLENVHRLLQSQPRTQRSNESSGSIPTDKQDAAQSHEKSHPSSPEEPTLVEEHAAKIVHRSHSAYELRPAMPLTRELLQQHTRQYEREYKDSWKMHYSQTAELLPALSVATKRAPPPDAHTGLDAQPSAKMFRDAYHHHRPASIPMLAGRPDVWQGLVPPKGADYYRSLGPNPPPPPGRNFQITSAPLPPPTAPPPPALELRKSAFAPVSNGQRVVDWSQPINLSIDDKHRSVIHNASFVNHLGEAFHKADPWLAAMSGEHMGTNLDDYHGHHFDPKDSSHAARLIGLAQNALNRANNEYFAAQRSPIEASPVKEATDALIMLQETS